MKFAFVVSHLGSGAYRLGNALNRIPGVLCLQSAEPYVHPTDLERLRRPGVRIGCDILNFNHLLASTALYGEADFLYVVRDPRMSLGVLLEHGYSKRGALDYYTFRLRRMYEMAARTPGATLLMGEQLSGEAVEEFFGRDVPELEPLEGEMLDWVPTERYEHYLGKFRELGLNTAWDSRSG